MHKLRLKWKVFVIFLYSFYFFCSRINKCKKKCSNSQFVFYVFTFIIGCNCNALSRDEIKKTAIVSTNKFQFYFVHLYDMNIKKNHVKLHRICKAAREVKGKKILNYCYLMLTNNIEINNIMFWNNI